MGAEVFYTTSKGKTAQEAFDEARRRAQWDRGHDGYTGTIAEKIEFVMIGVHRAERALSDFSDQEFAERLIREDDSRINDKWGPAGCIEVDENTWLFFGWASS